jgi:CheY-like chemotaxis protein
MEDDDLQAAVFERALSAEGHQVIVTSGATEAVAYLSEHQVDLIVTDIFVRHENGISADGGILLIGKIRNARFGADPKLPKTVSSIPIIATTGVGVSSYSRIDPLESARDLGADYVLRKPIDLDELNMIVNNALTATD